MTALLTMCLVRYWQFLRKTMATNPRRGPVHERAPSKILYRVIRGMVPHKTARGQSAMGKLKVFEGVPPMYNAQKKLVVPAALKVIRLKPNRKSCKLADLSNDVGWAHRDLMQKLKAKRDIKNAGWYAKKKEASKLMKESRVAANERLSSEDRALLLATGHL